MNEPWPPEPRWGTGINTTYYRGWRWWSAVFRRWWLWFALWGTVYAVAGILMVLR